MCLITKVNTYCHSPACNAILCTIDAKSKCPKQGARASIENLGPNFVRHESKDIRSPEKRCELCRLAQGRERVVKKVGRSRGGLSRTNPG
jgi:hypothetical protein